MLLFFVVPMAAGDAGMGDPEIMAMKVWKKSRRIGLVSLPDIGLLKAPYETYASRQDLREHVDKLKASFLRTQNTNRKGITFCVIDPELFGIQSSPFLKVSLKQYLGCPTGDHTRITCQDLADAYPQHPKYDHMAVKVSRATLSQAPMKT